MLTLGAATIHTKIYSPWRKIWELTVPEIRRHQWGWWSAAAAIQSVWSHHTFADGRTFHYAIADERICNRDTTYWRSFHRAAPERVSSTTQWRTGGDDTAPRRMGGSATSLTRRGGSANEPPRKGGAPQQMGGRATRSLVPVFGRGMGRAREMEEK